MHTSTPSYPSAPIHRTRFFRFAVIVGCTGLVAAPWASAKHTHYVETDLVSDVPGLAPVTDPHLVNPWGLSRGPTSFWWVSDAGAGVTTLYNGAGTINPLVVTIPNIPGAMDPSSPTGQVFNGSTAFQVGPNQPARFIFATEEGTISGWNPAANATNAILKVNRAGEAIYKGLGIGQIAGAPVLYAANFAAGTIDVFDGDYAPVTLPSGAFWDASIPKGYAPFNVQVIGDRVYVAYARQDDEKIDEIAGPGRGYVNAYSMDGSLLLRLQRGGWMNAPWGLALAPADFGELSGQLLVGQFGSGKIAAFDPASGKFRGFMRGEKGRAVRIEGLWALAFGGGVANNGATNALYFTAGIDDEAHGIFGTLTALPEKSQNAGRGKDR